ncbi:MAG: aldolase/citrate lyase family protein [Candidatus Dormiibacterota bacterium]
MRENRVKRTLARGEVSIGTAFFEFCTPGAPRVAAAAGAEFAFFDTEHTGWSNDVVRVLVAAAHGAGIVPLVRPPATQYHLLAQPLDLGAMGLIVPMVESREQAELIVRSTKYPPAGRRGAAFVIAHDDYQPGDVGGKMESANREILLISQIETAAGLEHADEIAAVAGIDVLWVGQFDLTASLGIPGQFDNPQYLSALDRVVEACRSHGKAAGFMVTSIPEAQQVLAKGFTALAYNGDLWLYQQALAAGVEQVRTLANALPAGGGRA